MCGEKQETIVRTIGLEGSPPHVRGKGAHMPFTGAALGITPACAGKSGTNCRVKSSRKDHPRMCGEKLSFQIVSHILIGSPPHVRGKAPACVCFWACRGITPACAGKSLTIPKLTTGSWDHPRMCGEKLHFPHFLGGGNGSPPHVRGKVFCCCMPWAVSGDHPRMCGEKGSSAAVRRRARGSPPHVRGKARHCAAVHGYRGITPACAGKRNGRQQSGIRLQDHPRMCGEKLPGCFIPDGVDGSPPHVRGKVLNLQ